MMPSDYEAIREDNRSRYGTDIGRYGSMLLADRYDDRTHFIFELLQNAEDALSRRAQWTGQRSVRFHLTERELRVSHFGQPFDEQDVRGVCGIAESTKDLTAIGRFGIGFKSVYAFTDRPEIHSGTEDFAIDNFVWPVQTSAIIREADETVIIIPLRQDALSDYDEIAAGLQGLGARTLLFLRHIEQIEWSIEREGRSGCYIRGQPEELDREVRRVTVLGQAEGESDLEERWLMFSRPITTQQGIVAGYVEIAFGLAPHMKIGEDRIVAIPRSPLIVFFPTVVETHLGFLVQGPYRTTPSRDNLPRHEPWNQHCLHETSDVLVQALHWLRDHQLLDTPALGCLPLDREKCGGDSMFAPLFEAVRHALGTKILLPRFGGGHTSAPMARLARTQELRDLFSPAQLAALFGMNGECAWLSSDISFDRTPELRKYLIQEIGISEVTPETILSKLDVHFLGNQPDAWILGFYEFLNGQPALRSRAAALPLVRLADGRHVKVRDQDQVQAFLPSSMETGFPTVRLSVCNTDAARAFLCGLGLTEPDPVDDVLWNVIPKYQTDEIDVSERDYEKDIGKIRSAFATDSKAQRERLIAALCNSSFLVAVDTKTEERCMTLPGKVYLATDRLKALFANVPDLLHVDDSYPCLRGEEMRDLLEACGVMRCWRPLEKRNTLSQQECRELRKRAGHPETSGYSDKVTDWSLHGLQEVLDTIPQLSTGERRTKAKLLWEELVHLEERRGKGVFTGEYVWTHYGRYSQLFDAAFVKVLNETAWITDATGNLERPAHVLFDELGWKQSPFLTSKIHFKPPIIDQLAKEAGFEPGMLDLLRKLGLTSEDQLRARLGVHDVDSEDIMFAVLPEHIPGNQADSSEEGISSFSPGISAGRSFPRNGNSEPWSLTDVEAADQRAFSPNDSHTGHFQGSPQGAGEGHSGVNRSPGSAGGRPFISYVGVHADDDEADPDGLDQAARIAIETQAIELICTQESDWQRTMAFNPGFDLFMINTAGQPNRWCEVKAMTGTLEQRPVGLSRTQYEHAREYGADYWLYIVERAGRDDARIIRIQDPVGKARTFTFDHGWRNVAELDSSTDISRIPGV